MRKPRLFKKVTPGTTSRLTIVDHTETYGRHLLRQVCRGLDISLCVDLGCGSGDDLATVREHNPEARCVGVDFGLWNEAVLRQRGITPISADIEHDALPFADETVDFFIANQVLEHTKEIFWINHEVFRSLRVGGHLYLGVPNVLSLHNRLLGLVGVHPTSAKLISGHVRVFSKSDTLLFYREVAAEFAAVRKFYGSQFYPFPRSIARLLAAALPSAAFSIFFVIQKTGPYHGEFVERLTSVPLETNFFKGHASCR